MLWEVHDFTSQICIKPEWKTHHHLNRIIDLRRPTVHHCGVVGVTQRTVAGVPFLVVNYVHILVICALKITLDGQRDIARRDALEYLTIRDGWIGDECDHFSIFVELTKPIFEHDLHLSNIGSIRFCVGHAADAVVRERNDLAYWFRRILKDHLYVGRSI